MDTLRDSAFGVFVRAITRNKVLLYKEEREGFELPDKYKQGEKQPRGGKGRRIRGTNDVQLERPITPPGTPPPRESDSSDDSARTVVEDEEREQNQDQNQSQNGEGGENNGENSDDIIVDWYGDDDQENPHNWSMFKKCWLTGAIMLMTSSVYMGSSIYSPAIQEAAQYFGLGQVTVTLGLSLFVVGYGVGPLFLSPITEIPQIGRTSPYIITLALFTILQVPTALVDNFAGFAILRFLAGFVGSPPLATGGASIQDVFAPHTMPYAMGLYGLSAASAPALAPIVSSFAVQAKGWRWAFWIMLWLSGFSLAVLFFWLPETSSNTILLRRAKRLRKLTGNDRIKAQSEIDSAQMTFKDIAMMSLVRPITMTFTEPIVLACDLFIGLIYAILYSYFESFPIVYNEGYGWSLGVGTLPFASLLVGAAISYGIYALWNKYYFIPRFERHGEQLKPEARLPMAMLAAFCYPICLFWFAWTANRTSWVSPVIASAFFGLGATWSFMPILTYLPHTYPQYAASVLASNDFFRSMLGAGMPLAAHGLFVNLGIDWGNSLLGFLTVLFIPIPFALWKFGPWLRARSPMALHDDDLKERDKGPHAVRAHEVEESA
ncbi:major facilitator superfamily domain-containing protein [Kockovaella imperatae]|uniref:Major facilitator superfamily domain-containing protein n=1 Tax=Kockovaella imperatae TaxID=4999 RepID=A0A1Y1UL32_9TREE|nr:major facilitator superfamily domain-containing protein [Kockovaella imperatae]ORX38204.1 major facilitator superfamily domain-containing protein [Kockovaella imperatae]